METKICLNAECHLAGIAQPIEDFHWQKKGVRRHSQCKKCTSETRKRQYEENKEEKKRYMREYMTDRKKLIDSHKTPCLVCGESDPICIDFHHVNPDNKFKAIAALRFHAWETVLAEINKCVCVCANCHRKIEWGGLDINLDS